jgi:CDP-diacylglycerol--serine O-phosphatidyltransferase
MMSGHFIIRVNPASALTLAGLGLDLAAFFLLLTGNGNPGFFLAVSLMYLGMLADAFDGVLARRYRWESEFGRYLDGFVDIFNYLVLPAMVLWRLGFDGVGAAAVLSVMIASGLLRLSKFNQVGNLTEGGEAKYLGLPVFWSQLALFPLYLLYRFAPFGFFYAATTFVWLGLAFAFVYNRLFFKPKNPWLMAGIILALSAASGALHFAGVLP